MVGSSSRGPSRSLSGTGGPRAETGAALLTETFFRHSSQVLFVFWEQAVGKKTHHRVRPGSRALGRVGGKGAGSTPKPGATHRLLAPSLPGAPTGPQGRRRPSTQAPICKGSWGKRVSAHRGRVPQTPGPLAPRHTRSLEPEAAAMPGPRDQSQASAPPGTPDRQEKAAQSADAGPEAPRGPGQTARGQQVWNSSESRGRNQDMNETHPSLLRRLAPHPATRNTHGDLEPACKLTRQPEPPLRSEADPTPHPPEGPNEKGPQRSVLARTQSHRELSGGRRAGGPTAEEKRGRVLVNQTYASPGAQHPRPGSAHKKVGV